MQESSPLVTISLDRNYEVTKEKCADLPCPLKRASVVLHDNKVYTITGYHNVPTDCYVYVYDINDNKWARLYPSPKQFHGTLQIINGKLTIIGGIIATENTVENYKEKTTNKVTTYNADNKSWSNEYRNLQKAREMPGALTHLNYVIVAGGRLRDGTFSRDIEFLDYKQPSQWVMAKMKLPVEMSYPSLTITGNTLYIVGFYEEHVDDSKIKGSHKAFKVLLPAAQFTENQKTQWTKIPSTLFGCTALIPNFSPPVIVGGKNKDGLTDDIRVLDEPNKSWKKIASLGFPPRFDTAVVPINHESILVIGGCTNETEDKVAINTVEKVTIRECHTQ